MNEEKTYVETKTEEAEAILKAMMDVKWKDAGYILITIHNTLDGGEVYASIEGQKKVLVNMLTKVLVSDEAEDFRILISEATDNIRRIRNAAMKQQAKSMLRSMFGARNNK